MSLDPFAQLEADVNDAVMRTMANTTISINGGQTVPALFDNGYTLGAVGPFGMASSQPRITCATDSLPDNPIGHACVVGGASYTIAEHQPDGTGISVLLLEVAA